jgi:signal transduction histidine kinase
LSLRLRLGLWYAAVLFASICIVGALAYSEVLESRRLAIGRHNPKVEEDDDAGLDIIQIGLSCAIPAALLGLVGGWWLMRRALAPVIQLTGALEKLQESNLRQQLPRTGNNDEFDRLIQVFNAMTARLEESFQRVREFTLHASHELKTPVTILHSELETALASPELSPATRSLMESQLDELQRLAKIVDGLTLLTKADAGLIILRPEPVRLDDLVRDALEDARILAQDRNLTVSLAECESVTLQADRHRLRQLLLNLTDNAVKYTEPGGAVILSLRLHAQQAELTVSNTSPGLPPEAAARVFDRFFRADSSRQDAQDGCGLGLSIAQWIVTAHVGSIRFDSPPAGPVTVHVRFPILPETPTPVPSLLPSKEGVARAGEQPQPT